MTQKEIFAYQDGAYEALKALPDKLENCKSLEDAIGFIKLTVTKMEKMSTRKLGLK